MNCNEYLPLLSGHLDGANSAAEEARLQKHLASCKQCRTLLAQLEQADTMLLSSKATPPADLTARIMTQVRKEAKQKKSMRRVFRSIGAAGLAAAALLALVFLGDLKLPFLRQDEGISTAMVDTDTTNDLVTADTLPEGMNFSFANQGFAAEQDNDLYGRNSASPEEVVEGIPASSTGSGTAKTAIDGEPNGADLERLLQLPSLAYGIGNEPESAEDAGTPHRAPSDLAPSAPASPLLVIWGADAQELSSAYDLSPTQEEQTEPASNTDSLYTRLLSALPPAKNLSDTAPQQGSEVTVTKYLVSYAQLSSLFTDCVGVYETAVYYPTGLSELENCTVLVISCTQATE